MKLRLLLFEAFISNNLNEKEVFIMPGGDRTGPTGMGPMTGRAAGYCAGYQAPGYALSAPGRYAGPGYGGGRGWRHRFYATGLAGRQPFAYGHPYHAGTPPYGYGAFPYHVPYGQTVTEQQELDALKTQAEHLENFLEGIKKRVAALEKKTEEE